MSTAFEKDNFLSLNKLSANNHYYQEVFKRGERVASVVFYVLSYIKTTAHTEVHYQNLSDKAMRLHEALIASLNFHEYEAKENLHDVMHAVVALESVLRVASASRLLNDDVEATITEEVDVLQRVLRNHYLAPEKSPYTSSDAPAATDTVATNTSSTPASPRPPKPAATPTAPVRPASNRRRASKAPVAQSAGARIERIKTVLEAKGEATIKDIAGVVTDCSEKTIQRDLNSLIEAGDVNRQGERRWSKYYIAKS